MSKETKNAKAFFVSLFIGHILLIHNNIDIFGRVCYTMCIKCRRAQNEEGEGLWKTQRE